MRRCCWRRSPATTRSDPTSVDAPVADYGRAIGARTSAVARGGGAHAILRQSERRGGDGRARHPHAARCGAADRAGGSGRSRGGGGGGIVNTAAFDIYGLPTIAVPCGFSASVRRSGCKSAATTSPNRPYSRSPTPTSRRQRGTRADLRWREACGDAATASFRCRCGTTSDHHRSAAPRHEAQDVCRRATSSRSRSSCARSSGVNDRPAFGKPLCAYYRRRRSQRRESDREQQKRSDAHAQKPSA
jgi:hypothetical protein